VCIGYNSTCTFPNTNVITALTNAIAVAANASFISPLRTTPAAFATGGVMFYNSTTSEIGYCINNGSTNKTFVINHPNYNDRYLVHACLEGPESGVYYRGKNEIIDNKSVKVYLPDYVENISNNFSIQITPIYSGKKLSSVLQVSEIEKNSFTVYGDNTSFYWLVHGKRCDINVEPLKTGVEVKGSGPYKWI